MLDSGHDCLERVHDLFMDDRLVMLRRPVSLAFCIIVYIMMSKYAFITGLRCFVEKKKKKKKTFSKS